LFLPGDHCFNRVDSLNRLRLGPIRLLLGSQEINDRDPQVP